MAKTLFLFLFSPQEEYPDYWTQGETEQELKESLLDIYHELTK